MDILYGKDVTTKILKSCKGGSLAIVCADKNAASSSYVKGINKCAQTSNTKLNFYNLNALDKIETIKENGILVLTPLPKDINKNDIYNKIPAKKDVDGASKNSIFYPCTAEAIISILDFYNIKVFGKNVCVVGRSRVVGLPVSKMLLDRDATVTICHSKTKNLYTHTRSADIVICAIGKPRYFTQKYFKKNQIVIDAGINWDVEENRLCGDCDYNINCAAITPVPGGVGAVTSAVLIKHCCPQ